MNINRLLKSDKIIYFWLFLIAFAVVFSSTFFPVNFERMHVDSSVYITITKQIIRGYLPYKDFVDNKGPLIYFMNLPGLYFGGIAGIWATELILFYITVFFAWKTALLFTTRKKALYAVLLSSIAILNFFFVNAGTEEYSLPFLTISFYIFSKYYFSEEHNVKYIELIILGICFACANLIRLNMFPLWAGFCTVILLESVIKKRFINILKYISGFLAGIILVVIPVFLYLKFNNIFDLFVEQVIFRGASRGFDKTLKDLAKVFLLTLRNDYSFLPLLFIVYLVIVKHKMEHIFYYAGFLFSFLLMVLFFSFISDDKHYNLVLFPYFIPVFAYLTDFLYKIFSNIYKKRTAIILLSLFFCFVFSDEIVNYLYDIKKLFVSDSTGKMLVRAGKMIDDNTKPGDLIISLGYDAYIYPFTKRDIASRYFYQSMFISIPGAREEFVSDILTKKPAIIALLTAIEGTGTFFDYWHKEIIEMLSNEYSLLSGENGYNLYIRNNRPQRTL